MQLNYALALKVLRDRQLLHSHSPLPTELSAGQGMLTTSSREVTPQGVFLAYRGVQNDSHRFIPDAMARGAGLLIVEEGPHLAALSQSVRPLPWLAVTCGRSAWSYLADAACGFPSQSIRAFGVTGTNGKTSTVWMLRSLLTACGVDSLSCGTLGLYWGEHFAPSPHTTPDPSVFYPFLAKVQAEGIDTVVMEVSSHALMQKKVEPLAFEGAAFTSFSRDHLDFHGDMASYWQAKWQLFSRLLKPGGRAVLHTDLASQVHAASRLPATLEAWWYQASTAQTSAARRDHEQSLQLHTLHFSALSTELAFTYQGQRYSGTIPYTGSYNCENFLAAWLLASQRLGAGVPASYWPQLTHVPGRLQPVRSASAAVDAGPQVLVDYAHTPDALAKALSTLRPLCRGRLWVVFGCGGDRDQGKRPEMGAIACQLADEVVITSDNPRSEDPATIIAAIVAGCQGSTPRYSIEDRQAAIGYAITEAAAHDIVLIAGKGHEAYQIIAGEQFAFDDRLVAQTHLSARLEKGNL